MTLDSIPRLTLIPALLLAGGCASSQRAQIPTPQLPVPQLSAPKTPAPKVSTPQNPAAKSSPGSTKAEPTAPAAATKDTQTSGSPPDAAPEENEAENQGTTGGARTPDEHREALDHKLDGSLSAFDAMLLKEQQQAAQKRAEHATPTGSEGTGSGEGSEGGSASAGGGPSAGGSRRNERASDEDRATGSSQGGDRSTGGGRTTIAAPEGSPKVPASENVPPDVGDGRDDDVVARQIREAATQEQDPAIREKLWEEYRRYKASRSGSGT